jgi:flavin reductase (DIM6/NTAB) family NADH-FMN oxidoreductase RutF
MTLNSEQIKALNYIEKINLINSITGIKPANLIGTKSNNGSTNLAIFSSVVHLGSNPAYIGFVLRPETEVRRHTYENIIETEEYTINHVHQSFVEKAHYTSAKFEKDESEFEFCKLSEMYLESFSAPFVAESKLKFGLKLQEVIPIKSNNTNLVVGEIVHLIIEDKAILKNGNIDLEQIGTSGIGGLNSYYELKKINEFPYARKAELPKF